MSASTLAPDVRAVLERAAFDGGVLKLPGDQLERKLYVAVNAALESLGGKWNRGKQGHVFATDAEAKLRGMLSKGVVPPKNPNAFFPTPADVVERMLDLAEIPEEICFVLEPSAGTGAIAMEVMRRYPMASVDCVEVDEERAGALSDAGLRNVFLADFLAFDGDTEASVVAYDRIVMNPPFAVEGDATAWMTHVRHALTMLSPFGVLVSVVPSGFAFREDRKHVAFRRQIAGRSSYEALDANAFKESGTGVSSGLLVIQGELVGGRR